MRPIRTIVLPRIARLAAAWALLVAPAALAQQDPEYRLTVRAVQWEVQHQQQTHIIHGLAIEGSTGDINGNQANRDLRALLMPTSWHAEPNHADAQLQFTLDQLHSGSETYQAIDLEFGAALVELDPSAARIASVAPLMRQAALASLKDDQDRVQIPLPAMRKDFDHAVREFVNRKRAIGFREQTDQEIIQQAQDRELSQTLSSFWPMFITRSITAGAEGTDALLLALPSENAQPDAFVCFARYLSGTNFRMLASNTTMPPMSQGQHIRVDITQTTGNPPQISPGTPSDQPPPQIVAWAHDTLCQGWQQVFGVACPTPPEDADPSPRP